MRGDDTKPEGKDVKIFVVGDRSRDAVVLDLPRRSNAGRHAHYANHQYYVLPGGIDHLALMIEGAAQERLRTTVNLTFQPTAKPLSIELKGKVLEISARSGRNRILGRIKVDRTFDGELAELRINGDVEVRVSGSGKGADMGVRPNVVMRAWEFIRADVNIKCRATPKRLKHILDQLGVSYKELKSKTNVNLTLHCGEAELHVSRGIGVGVKVKVTDKGAPEENLRVPAITLGKNYKVREFIAELAKYPQTPYSSVPERLDVSVYRRSRMLGQRDELSKSTFGETAYGRRSGAISQQVSSIVQGQLPSNPCVCCINDDGLGFTEQPEAIKWLKQVSPLSHNLIWVIKAGRFASFRDDFYTELLSIGGARDRSLAITSADALRAGSGAQSVKDRSYNSPNYKSRDDRIRPIPGDFCNSEPADHYEPTVRDGIRLSQDVSWELVIEDVLEAINSGALRDRRGVPDVLIIMFGLAGAAIVRKSIEGSDVKSVDFIFDPRSTEHDYAPELRFGGVGGTMSVFAAKVAAELKEWLKSKRKASDGSPLDGFVKPGLGAQSELVNVCVEAIRASRRCFDYGYGPSERTVNRCRNSDFPTTQIFYDPNRKRPKDPFAVVSFENVTKAAPDVNVSWSLLEKAIEQAGKNPNGHAGARSNYGSSQSALTPQQRGAFGLASDIVRDGLGVLRPSVGLSMPILRVGKLTTVDRREIEGLRTLESVFRRYLSSSDTRPASVAVFGAPGSGKSWSVKEVIRTLDADHKRGDRHPKLREMEFNMTQFATAEELSSAVLDLSNACVEGEIPVAFFDEFDVQDNDVFRWVNRFLPLMEDGQVNLRGKRVRIGKSILVFAGGVHTRFGEFADIKNQKVPDFVSRLRGYLDVAGPNPRDATPGELAQSWIRRAVQIRSQLEQMWIKARLAAHFVDSDTLDVEWRILNALVRVDKYHHGSRSVRSLLGGCNFVNASAFTVSMLPPRSLIEMDVTEDFFSLLRQPRA